MQRQCFQWMHPKRRESKDTPTINVVEWKPFDEITIDLFEMVDFMLCYFL